MRILSLGASSETSIGYQMTGGIEYWCGKNHHFRFASRSGKLGTKCDALEYKQVCSLLEQYKPHAVVYAAGVFIHSTVQRRGEPVPADAEVVRAHMLAKSVGAWNVLHAAANAKSVKKVIMLGGRSKVAHPSLGMYAMANAALWSAVQLMAYECNLVLQAYYIDMPLVLGSTMEQQLCPALNYGSHKWDEKSLSVLEAVESKRVGQKIGEVLRGQYPSGARVMVGPDW